MKDAKQQEGAIGELLQLLEQFLCQQGFLAAQPTERGELHVHSWVRTDEWHEERIELSFPRKDPFMINVFLGLHLPCRQDELVLLDGISLVSLLNKNSAYTVPTFLESLRKPAFFRSVKKDVEESLSWFGRYSTPELSLARLNSGETGHGQSQSRLVKDCRSFLEQLVV